MRTTLNIVSDVLERARALSALACVDRFVEEQRPDGNWAASTFGRRGCGLSRSSSREWPS